MRNMKLLIGIILLIAALAFSLLAVLAPVLYPIIFKYLYTVGRLNPHTRANSLMFILPEM